MRGPQPLSGFPEWLPEQRLVEQELLDRVRARFELHGFVPVETRAVEPLDQLLAKGETDKEIYVLRRLQAEPDSDDAGLGLHFDLTVPFARYVLENRGRLQFPLRRYQMQKSWRGERPQEGRYREFLQVDADIVGQGTLGLHADAELLAVAHDVLGSLPIPPVTMRVNNRKVLEGCYRALGIEDTQATLRTVDKLDKIGEAAVGAQLVEQVGLDQAQAKACLEVASISSEDASFADAVRALGLRDDLLDEGLAELTEVMRAAARLPAGRTVADLRISRGLDYYTGTVYEAVMAGHERLGTVCAGGRYDDLASAGTSVRFPGVGVSIGLTRILGRLFGLDLLRASRRTPSCVLVALPSEADRERCAALAGALRARGIPCEVAHEPARYGKQIRTAERKGIPYVWFPEGEVSGGHEVRDIRSGEQHPADPDHWTPPADELHVRLLAGEAEQPPA
jgi:histidyl-tRNA synthetase